MQKTYLQKDNMSNTLKEFLVKHANKKPVSFHMPGHKGKNFYLENGYGDFVENLVDYDITEIPGADNLFQTESVIEQAQEEYAKLYDVKKSYLLINGTSGGIIAAILSSVSKGGQMIMARNCHKSVFNALILGDIKPIYAYPELLDDSEISGPISPEEIKKLIVENPKAEAIILPSPNYYGICSDIKALAKIAQEAGKILIVDQAHGAHLKFFNKYNVEDMPVCAEEAGADIVINSTHKTLASFTQSAILNVTTDEVDLSILEDKLQAIQSTSPSYMLMASLDINGSLLKNKGEKLIREWRNNLEYFYEEASKIEGLEIMKKNRQLDYSKLNFNLCKLGISGEEIEEYLIREKGVFIELFTGDWVMCMTGIGNKKEDIDKLLEGLKEIAEKYSKEKTNCHKGELHPPEGQLEITEIPKYKEKVSLSECEGRVCASSIIPYPPGIPIVCPGEILTKEMGEYVKTLRSLGEKVIGVDKEGKIIVGRE